jgi:ABC-type sugar transport system permease subunit
MAETSLLGGTRTQKETTVPAPPTRRSILRSKTLTPYFFIAPFLLTFLAFTIGPDIYALVLSFYRYRGYGSATFVGWENYHAVLTYHVFWTELSNTLFYWLAHTLPLIVIAFGLAVLVRSKVLRGRSWFKPIIFVPNVIAVVAASLVFQNLFSTQYGVINTLFHLHIAWLEDPTVTRWVVVLLLIWRNLGFWFVVFLAGLTSINPDLEEAAIVDGANAWQRLRYIIVPLMRNIVFFAFIIDAITSMSLYTEPNVLTAGGSLAIPPVAPVLNLLIVNLNNGVFGQSAAVGWLVFLLTAVIATVVFGLFRLTGEGE